MSTLPLPRRPALADDDPLLADLQCNILSPHRRTRSVHLLVTLPPTKADALRYVARWGRPGGVTTMRDQLAADLLRWSLAPDARTPRGVVKSFMLSAVGLWKLGFHRQPDGADRVSADPAFCAGMRLRESALFFNQGRPPADPFFTHGWQPPFATNVTGIDAHILLAADGVPVPGEAQPAESAELTAAVAAATADLGAEGGRIVARFDGYEATNAAGEPVEHFGFRDGISNPLFLASEQAYAAAHRPAPAFGHTLANAIVALERGAGFGAHCVFRVLEQDVAAFAALAPAAAAAIVGRHPDGTSLVAGSRGGAAINAFDYGTAAAPRPGCPFHAHVRKANPRGSSGRPEDPTRLFARRGMLYGRRPHQPDRGFTGLPANPVGLLFLGYMGSIEMQFEAMQREWLAGKDFPADGSGFDCLAGLFDRNQALDPTQSCSAGGMRLPDYVKVRGGEHFLVPPVSWLLNPR